MPRQPNTDDATGIWDVTRPNQQRNAKYGERWPETYIPVPAWSGTRYFSLHGYNGAYVSAYNYNNSRTVDVAWAAGTGSLATGASYAYTWKISNQTRIMNTSGEIGWSGATWSDIYYITCSSLGTSIYWGDATHSTQGARGGSNGTYGIHAGGKNASNNNISEKRRLTIMTTASSATFGNLTGVRYRHASASGSFYFCTFGGQGNGPTTQWDMSYFVTGGGAGNAGNLDYSGSYRYNYDCDAIDNDTSRLVIAGGAWQYGGHGNAMFHYSTSSWGNGGDYANMAIAMEANSTTGDGTYGVIAGGQGQSAYESRGLIFNIATLAAATQIPNQLPSGVTRNGAGAGSQ